MQGWVDMKIHQYAPVHFGFKTYTENADVCSGDANTLCHNSVYVAGNS